MSIAINYNTIQKMENKVSVIVPIYQVGIYLEKCIRSIIQQSYRNIEIILIDDGSMDNSPKICDDFAQLDSRIHVVHQVNGGGESCKKCWN